LKAIEEHIARNGELAVVTRHPAIAGSFKTRFLLGDRKPLVSLLIPTRDRRDLLETCVTSIHERTTYRHFEIIVVDNESSDAGTLQYLEHLEHWGTARVLRYAQPFNWSAINNFAVAQARGDVIALLNNDIEVLDSSWLENMAALAVRPAIGAVGAMLLYPDRTVQHAGIVLGLRGIAGHPHRLAMPCASENHGRLQLLQNYSAVTGACLVVSKDRYFEAGGMDEDLAVAYNDVAFCLKLRQLGYRNVWTPDAVLLHKESASRGYEETAAKRARLASEGDRLRARWQGWIDDDPFYNPNL
jgi:GT2 family glycosyltransferase